MRFMYCFFYIYECNPIFLTIYALQLFISFEFHLPSIKHSYVIVNFMPQVDIFMDAAFGAVHVIVMFLQIKLSDQLTDEQVVNYICQQCEASLQFLQSLCQQKSFREHLLRNKVSNYKSLCIDVWEYMCI